MKTPHHLLATLKRSVEEFNLLRVEGEALDFSGADLNCARLGGARLSGVDLSGVNLRSADLDGADLRGANLSGAILSRASLEKAQLQEARLAAADLTDADLTRVKADGADFQRAVLTRASLRRASLRGAKLTQAKLAGADLSNADLSGAYVVEVDFSDVKVEGIRRDAIRLGFLITEVPEVDYIAVEHGLEGLTLAGQAGPYVLTASARGDRVWVLCVEHLGLFPAFRFIDQTQIRGLKKLFSGEDVILGDAPLDDATHIEGDPAQLSARLDVEARGSLLAWWSAGGTIEDGVLRCVVPRDHLQPLLLRRVELIPHFQRACRIAHALSRPLSETELTDALLERARLDPVPGVRHRALARYVGRRAKDSVTAAANWGDGDGLFRGVSPEDSEGACILLLDADGPWLPWSAARWLGEFGTVLALKRLLEVANGTFVDLKLRLAAHEAAEAILGRNGGDGAGRLSVLDTGAEGAVSFPDSDE